MDWNNFTQTTALLIDNNREALQDVLGIVRNVMLRAENTAQKSIAHRLNRYIEDKLCLRPASKYFSSSLLGSLALEALAQVQWDELALHYLQKYEEQK